MPVTNQTRYDGSASLRARTPRTTPSRITDIIQWMSTIQTHPNLMNLPSPALATEGKTQANVSLEHLDGATLKATRLTVFFAADDREIEHWDGEQVFHSEWLELPVVPEELGNMGGSDRWEVLEVVQFAHDRIVDLAIVHPVDLIEPAREEWLSIKHGEAIYLYLDKDGEFVTGGIGPNESPMIGETLIGFPCKVASFVPYLPVGRAKEHFERLYVCVCI
jgi:hypothetical protein